MTSRVCSMVTFSGKHPLLPRMGPVPMASAIPAAKPAQRPDWKALLPEHSDHRVLPVKKALPSLYLLRLRRKAGQCHGGRSRRRELRAEPHAALAAILRTETCERRTPSAFSAALIRCAERPSEPQLADAADRGLLDRILDEAATVG